MTNHCAVIGNPVAHSLSPVIHHVFAEQVNLSLSYTKIRGDEASFEQQVRDFFAAQGKGLNVTLPFKQRAYAMAKIRSERCIKAGAANTLWYSDNKLHADNTDGVGLIRDLSHHCSLANAKILILGAGGAARGIIHPLLEAQPQQLWVANRSREPLLQLQKDIPQIQSVEWSQLNGEFDLIINATSAGALGKSLTLPKELMANLPFCYDLMYQLTTPTPFVQYAQQQGCQATDGLGMLVEQAAESFYLWHGLKPKTEPIKCRLALSR